VAEWLRLGCNDAVGIQRQEAERALHRRKAEPVRSLGIDEISQCATCMLARNHDNIVTSRFSEDPHLPGHSQRIPDRDCLHVWIV
jgi:hypothetical protein